jgi:hypothetical protein
MKAKYAVLLICLALLVGGCAATGPYNPGGLLGASPYNPPIPPLNAEPAITAGTSLQYWRGDKTWQTLNPAAAGAEPAITAGTSLQYWRGDKTWQTLNSAAVGSLPITGGTLTGDLALSPGNLTFTPLTPPTAPTLAAGAAGSVTNGTHYVAITFLTESGETVVGTPSAQITITGNDRISVSAIPTGPAGTTGRNIYMTKNGIANTGPYYLVSNGGPTINDNTTATATINVADTTLGTGNYVAAAAMNTTAGIITGATLTQSQISGLTTSSSPTFAAVNVGNGSQAAPTLHMGSTLCGFYTDGNDIYVNLNDSTYFTLGHGGIRIACGNKTWIQDGNAGQLRIGTTSGAIDGYISAAHADLSAFLNLTPQTGAPATPATGTIAIADRANWDPLSKASGGPYPVWYNGSAWVSVAGQ